MPPRTGFALANSVFDFSRLLQSLPSSSLSSLRSQPLTRCSTCLFSTSPAQQSIGKKKKKVKRRVDPYRAAQARQRKAVNVARQGVLQQERQEAMGDPVRSTPTPFLTSLLSPRGPDDILPPQHLNYFLKPKDLQSSLEYSRWLTEPLDPQNANLLDPEAKNAREERHADMHANAERALSAITALEIGNNKDRTRVNIQRCIEAFGRHRTDETLPSKPRSTDDRRENILPTLRAGPDTGSSEVQAAILTAKINVLADNLHKKDKHNKRNLRLLVHRRQKLLSYLRRKERGGPRWQHLVENMGLGDAMWKGEISL